MSLLSAPYMVTHCVLHCQVTEGQFHKLFPIEFTLQIHEPEEARGSFVTDLEPRRKEVAQNDFSLICHMKISNRVD